jgi:valyl-tRNA synthetase
VDDTYVHEVPVCYKCEREIEPQVRPQWFVRMQPLAAKAIEAVRERRVHVLTENHEKILLHWLENIQDWNVSRQIVWGIPIPAWFKDGEYRIGEESPGEGWTRDPDTFDTWFSSGQWPYITLGYPDSPDFKTFYPTDVMESGSDLVFFWIARMIMFGLYRTGEVPFKKVYLHGLVRDAKGQKMSKSKGNVISPLEVSNQYGTDALRMGLVVGNTPGTDLNLDPKKIEAYKKFANKLWNIARFVLSQDPPAGGQGPGELMPALVEEFDTMAADITKDINEYRIYMAAEKLYHYVWDRFAAQIIEESKGKPEYGATLYYILENSLKLLHPFMPFITEEIWSSLPEHKNVLMVEKWPTPSRIL